MARATTGLLLTFLCALGALASQPADARQPWLGDWAAQKTDEIRARAAVGPDEADPLNQPVPLAIDRRRVAPLTGAAAERSDAIVALYESLVGANSPLSLMWTGVETGNPLTRREDYRWDSLRDQGMFDADRRAKTVEELQSLGLVNVRVGFSNHEIDLDEPRSWLAHDRFIADFAEAGLNLSLDLHHFGVEDRFRAVDAAGETVPEASYYLHPDWPDYFARFAGQAFARYGNVIKAVTIINEPETTVGFNSEMWHGGFPGWGDPRHERYYVERAFAIASGAVKARMAIEAERRKNGARVFFMHTEAAVAKPGRPEFNRFARFFPSDLILGKSWLTEADLADLAGRPVAAPATRATLAPDAARSSLDWLFKSYVLKSKTHAERAAARARLVELVGGLKRLHERLQRDYGVAMREDTVFAADYYAHNEDRGTSGGWLSPEPQLYAAQIAEGERSGLYPLLVDYHERYGLPMMIGETGTPFYAYGARWHKQMLLESAAAMADGVPLLGYTVYPLIDTWGWETALSVPKSQTTVNTGGLLTGDLEPRPFIRALMKGLNARAVEAEVSAVASDAVDAPEEGEVQ